MAPQRKKGRATKRQPVPPAPVIDQEKFITPTSGLLCKDQCAYRNIVEGRTIQDVPHIYRHFALH